MKRLMILITALWVMLGLSTSLLAQGYTQDMAGNGQVNWSQHVIRCTGIGAPNPNLPMAAQRASALRVAQQAALRNILETVKGISLTSETTVENAMLTSDRIQTRVQGALRGFRVVDTRYMSSGDVEVDVEIPLTGVVANELLPQAFGGGALLTGGQLLCPVCGQGWPEGKPVPRNVNLIQTGGESGAEAVDAVFTGLIIDGRGLGVRPAMAPKVLNETGEEVYGTQFVGREYAVDIGMAGYEKDINRAMSNERVTDKPIVVQAVRAAGPSKSDLVISDADAMKIHNATSNNPFLKYCKVMIILD